MDRRLHRTKKNIKIRRFFITHQCLNVEKNLCDGLSHLTIQFVVEFNSCGISFNTDDSLWLPFKPIFEKMWIENYFYRNNEIKILPVGVKWKFIVCCWSEQLRFAGGPLDSIFVVIHKENTNKKSLRFVCKKNYFYFYWNFFNLCAKNN